MDYLSQEKVAELGKPDFIEYLIDLLQAAYSGEILELTIGREYTEDSGGYRKPMDPDTLQIRCKLSPIGDYSARKNLSDEALSGEFYSFDDAAGELV